MPFAYYQRLSRPKQRIYDRSDHIEALALPAAGLLQPMATDFASALASQDRRIIQAVGQRLLDALLKQLTLPPIELRLLSVRPADHEGELHGLYVGAEAATRARITLWMRTAQRKQVVKFRTLLRTLLHELLHHHDFEGLGLDESFHTEGFFKRESHLLRQLIDG